MLSTIQTQAQYTNHPGTVPSTPRHSVLPTGTASPSIDPLTPGVCKGSHYSTKVQWTDVTRSVIVGSSRQSPTVQAGVLLLGLLLLLLPRAKLYLWGSLFFFFGVPAMSLGFAILLLLVLLRAQLYLWVHQSSPSSFSCACLAISLGSPFWVRIFGLCGHFLILPRAQLYLWGHHFG